MFIIEGILGFIFKFILGVLSIPFIVIVAVILALRWLLSAIFGPIGKFFKDVRKPKRDYRGEYYYDRREYR